MLYFTFADLMQFGILLLTLISVIYMITKRK